MWDCFCIDTSPFLYRRLRCLFYGLLQPPFNRLGSRRLRRLLWAAVAASGLAWERALEASLLWASSVASGLADEQAREASLMRLARLQS